MSKSVKIELNSAGIQELLKSVGIANVCLREAERMSEIAGVEYKFDLRMGKTRVSSRANVGDSKLGRVGKKK